MFLVTSNPGLQLLFLAYAGDVTPEELRRRRPDLETLAAGLRAGLRVLVDFTHLDRMAVQCAEEIGFGMELLDRHEVSLVVRVIPDPHKDIGMSILTLFHYKHRPRILTCKNLSAAAKLLAV
ncbi:MAG TPA: hypothetical protein PKN95_02990 [Verrucomicrobiota bacterium]|nr:hypothetical protein [Verrucomicrobiota bacterium]HNT13278.1 hypothetical protein [Verrucomicrobiota bacterium]